MLRYSRASAPCVTSVGGADGLFLKRAGSAGLPERSEAAGWTTSVAMSDLKSNNVRKLFVEL